MCTSEESRRREGNVALKAAPNPFLCTLYANKICLNQSRRKFLCAHAQMNNDMYSMYYVMPRNQGYLNT